LPLGAAVCRRSNARTARTLTLGRSDGVADLRPLVERLAPWEGLPWVATRLYLIRSRLGAGLHGCALYEPFASWPLDT
jgi:hypothetical protein